MRHQRGYIDFSALLWAGLLFGLILGGCGFCAGSYVVRHLDVSVEWK